MPEFMVTVTRSYIIKAPTKQLAEEISSLTAEELSAMENVYIGVANCEIEEWD